MNVEPGAPELQGHRGARGLAPENTLAGFRRALAIGVNTLELDVAMTADGVVVVHHDPTLNPDTTRDARGAWLRPQDRVPLHSLPLARVRELDVGRLRPGSSYARRFARQTPAPGERIPTLAEVAALLHEPGAGRIRLNVEVKTNPTEPALTPPPEAFADAVVEVLERAQVAARATVQSFDWRVQARVQEKAPHIVTGYLSAARPRENTVHGRGGAPSPWTAGLDVDAFQGSVPDMVRHAGGDVWSPQHHDLDPVQLLRARALGLRTVVWTVNTRADIRRALRLGVDGIISDYPDRVRAALAAAGLPLPPALGAGEVDAR